MNHKKTITPQCMLDPQVIRKRLGPCASQDDPIFILSAGWRCGSTLMQRICSTEDRIIWGEPYGHHLLMDCMKQPLSAITHEWPPEHFFLSAYPKEKLPFHWISNLYPPLHSLREAYRSFFEALFVRPAREAGFRKWGAKFVRLTADIVPMLRWLWPESKIVFLVRHPLDAWSSYYRRTSQGNLWYLRWPDTAVDVHVFAGHWRECAGSFTRSPCGILVAYEHLNDRDFPSSVVQYLGVKNVNFEAMKIRSGSSSSQVEVPPGSIETVRKITSETAKKLGYSM